MNNLFSRRSLIDSDPIYPMNGDGDADGNTTYNVGIAFGGVIMKSIVKISNLNFSLVLLVSLLLITQVACSDTLKKSQPDKESDVDYSQLKQSIKNHETDISLDTVKLAYGTCHSLNEKANGDINKLRQAYLWCALGDIEKGIITTSRPFSSTGFALDQRYNKKGKLELVDPKLAAVWHEQKKAQKYLKHLALPDLLIEVRKELATADMPIFSTYFRDEFIGYLSVTGQLDIYADGRALFRGAEIKSDSQTAKAFMQDLNTLGFYDWDQPSYEDYSGDFCDMGCDSTNMTVATREGTNVQRYYSYAVYEAIGDSKPPARFEAGVRRYDVRVRMAKLRLLIERYFPTQELRCMNKYSEKHKEFRNRCINSDKLWEKQVKEEQ